MTKFERRRQLWILVVVLCLVLTSLCSFAYAKYVKSESLQGSITLKAELGTIVLQEHQAVRQADGSYVLNDEIAETGNQYTLIPGLDVRKDPYVVITKPNDIPVYVYVEVVDTLGEKSGITWSIAEGWTELTGVTGPNGGKVYYYNEKVTQTSTIYIMDSNTVHVSQELDKNAENWKLTFYASMKQAVEGQTAAQIYVNKNNY